MTSSVADGILCAARTDLICFSRISEQTLEFWARAELILETISSQKDVSDLKRLF